jgi:hypothetical protein
MGYPTVNIVVKPTVAGTITNTASVTAFDQDPNQSNNSDSENTTPGCSSRPCPICSSSGLPLPGEEQREPTRDRTAVSRASALNQIPPTGHRRRYDLTASAPRPLRLRVGPRSIAIPSEGRISHQPRDPVIGIAGE